MAYSVGYNIDMLSVAPTAALTSATNDWGVYYTYAFNCALNGEEIATDWCEGYETSAVGITELGESCAEGTADKVAEVEAALKSGELQDSLQSYGAQLPHALDSAAMKKMLASKIKNEK